MKFVLKLIVVSVIAVVALVKFYEIEGIDGLHLKRRESSAGMVEDLRAMFTSATAEPGSGFSPPGVPAPPNLPSLGLQTVSSRQTTPGTIRLGTFNLREFSREKLNDPKTMDFIVRLLQQIDLIAVQEVDADRRELFPRIVEHLNRDGRTYDFIAGPQVGPDGYQQLLGFVYDRQRVEADLKQTYTVTDPANQIAYEPLVGWFRTVGVDPQDAWTFSMANVYVDPDNPQKELELLTSLFHSIQNDGRGEDDVILAGCFFAGDHELAGFASADIRFALEGTPSDIHAQRQTANLLFNRNHTTEFLGNSGAIDFLRQYNLTIAEAEAVSDHLPVWAEFQIREAVQF